MRYTPRQALAYAVAIRELEGERTMRAAAIARNAQADDAAWRKFVESL